MKCRRCLTCILLFLPAWLGTAAPHCAATGTAEHRSHVSSSPSLLKEPSCLSVSRKDGPVVLQKTLLPDETVLLRHRHSVHKSLVHETLGACADNALAILEGRYEDYGAGLPQKAEAGQRLEFSGGKARLVLAPICLSALELRVGRLAEHTLLLKHKEFALAEMIEPGMVAILEIRGKVCPREYP